MNHAITPYDDVNRICDDLSQQLSDCLGKKLLGVYLTGSLTYGGFNRGSSDIDFLIILQQALSQEERQHIENIHRSIAQQYPLWEKRIEASYITKEMLNSETPPTMPRIYINEGQMYEALYGYEWLLNLHAWYECGVVLRGIEPKSLMEHSVSLKAVKIASKQDFYQEWEPLLSRPNALNNSHYQAYAILTLCRILYREKNNNVASKKIAAEWVKKTHGYQWGALIKKAQDWHHGQAMNEADTILQFIQFISDKLR